MITPAPYDFEMRKDYLDRLDGHVGMIRAYPTAIKRRLAGERRWAKAKKDSLVSITTNQGEALLFGGLN